MCLCLCFCCVAFGFCERGLDQCERPRQLPLLKIWNDVYGIGSVVLNFASLFFFLFSFFPFFFFRVNYHGSVEKEKEEERSQVPLRKDPSSRQSRASRSLL